MHLCSLAYPDARWHSFRPSILIASCPPSLPPPPALLQTIGAAYITRLRQELGWDAASYYIADSFNEMKPASSDPGYLQGISASVFHAMVEADPNAVWLMQAWLFFSDHRFWQPEQIKVGGGPEGSGSMVANCIQLLLVTQQGWQALDWHHCIA